MLSRLECRTCRLVNTGQPSWEPDALTAHVRFWDGVTLNRLSPSFVLNLKERARSTHPKFANGCFSMEEFASRTG